MGMYPLIEDAMYKRLDELRAQGLSEDEAAEVWGGEQSGVRAKLVETPSPVDDEETRAFIAGWNAAMRGGKRFDLALHWWNRDRCGI